MAQDVGEPLVEASAVPKKRKRSQQDADGAGAPAPTKEAQGAGAALAEELASLAQSMKAPELKRRKKRLATAAAGDGGPREDAAATTGAAMGLLPKKTRKKQLSNMAFAGKTASHRDTAGEGANSARVAASSSGPFTKRKDEERAKTAEVDGGELTASGTASASPAKAGAAAPGEADSAGAPSSIPHSGPAGNEHEEPGKASSGRGPDVERTVFVDGVPYVWQPSKIKEFFDECGEVLEVRAPTWQDSGRLRGFAHVTFATTAARKKALAMNGSKVGKKARYLKIEPAKAAEPSPSVPTQTLDGKRRLFVKNLPYDATEKELVRLFARCGKVKDVRVPTSFGRAKGFAYIEFGHDGPLKAAFKLDPPPTLHGRTLRLDADEGQGPKAGFHYRPEAFNFGFGQKKKGGAHDGDRKGRKGGGGKGQLEGSKGGKGGKGGKGKGGRGPSLF